VTDPALKKELYTAYQEELMDYNFWMEQMRLPELRHPAFPRSGDPEEELKKRMESPGWADAPALIVVLGDGRRQWATVMGGHTMGRHQSHLTDGMANTCTLIHLAAASMGLGSQWVTIHIEDWFKRILNVPDVMLFYSIIPVGYPDVPPKEGVRRPLDEIVHKDKYDRSKYLSNRQIVDYVRELRGKTMPKYKQAIE
jgi:nitroreductase